jgi:hypothetical protein
LLLEGVLPLSEKTHTGSDVLIQGVKLRFIKVPLHGIHFNSDLVSGNVVVGVRPTLPVKGVSLLLGNDIAGGKVVPDPIICEKPSLTFDGENTELSPSCEITRSMTKKLGHAEQTASQKLEIGESSSLDLNETFLLELMSAEGHIPSYNQQSQSNIDMLGLLEMSDNTPLTEEKLISEQKSDVELQGLNAQVLSPEETDKVLVC